MASSLIVSLLFAPQTIGVHSALLAYGASAPTWSRRLQKLKRAFE